MILAYLLSGTLLLYLGAEFLIRGGAALALRLGLPLLVIGLIIMGYGTGAPELVVSVQASLANEGDIALGNVIGSNIANTGLVLGFAAMVHPMPIHKRLLDTDTPFMILVALGLFGIFLISPVYTRIAGVIFLAGLAVYTIWSIDHGMKTHIPVSEPSPHAMKHWLQEVLCIVGGLALLLLGGKFFLTGAVTLAQLYGISDRVIGLTVVAIGTSLPELAASLVAAYKKQGDMAIGNVVGSNIFNMLGIVGFAAIINPIQVNSISWLDFFYMIALFIGLWLIIRKGDYITRREGALMFASYIAYMVYLTIS